MLCPVYFVSTDRWKNAGPETHKRMFSIFDEAGIFITCCRHRMVLYACDMIKSGELLLPPVLYWYKCLTSCFSAKYPLAMVNRLLEDVGNDVGCAYDIGCAFSKTLADSRLGAIVWEKHFRMMVGAFHGHAHNRACQLLWHPLYITGSGLTEGEGCEHVFASSNELARNTRHSSRFHRTQAIEDHFHFWDEDKYALLSPCYFHFYT